MEISGAGGAEDRIAALEMKSREMDAMVKGLLNELLDLKTVSMKLSREAGQYRVVEYAEAPAPAPAVASDGSTVIRPRNTRQPEVAVAPKEPEMVRIMQNDGTMKMEPRYGAQDHIDSAGYGRNRKGQLAPEKQAPLIYAADEEKSGKAKK
jgi:hypothetical protein